MPILWFSKTICEFCKLFIERLTQKTPQTSLFAAKMVRPNGFEPLAFRLGENRTHFTLLCRDALQSRKVQEYQGFANEVLGLRYATYRPVTACSSG